MKKRTKITLTIVGLLALTGTFYAANPSELATVPNSVEAPDGAGCLFSTSSSTNFNNFAINQPNFIWFSSVLKAAHLPSNAAVNVEFFNQTITSPDFGPLSVPNAIVRFDPAVTMASTTFVAGHWLTTVPSNPTLKGNTFFSGLSFPVPVNLPGSIRPVTWSGVIIVDTPGVNVNWQWAAANYTTFTTAYNNLGVKPVDDKVQNPYLNADHAGTPEFFKQFVIAGATGGGGHNYTGSLSGTKTVKCP
jgi:hypothetical protein